MTETREGTDVVERLTFTTRPVGDITMLDFRSGGCRPASDVEIECLAEIGRLRTLLSSSRGEQGWRTIDSAPKDGTEVLGWREDCGPILVRWTSAGDFLTDAEAEESGMTEEQLYEESWFYADFVQGGRLAADEYPTHWMPLPSAPGSVPTSLAGQVPDGYVLVPKEPTPEMCDRGESRLVCGPLPEHEIGTPSATWAAAKSCYAAMLSAASPQPTAGGDAPKLNIMCEYRDDSVPVIGTRNLNVIRVEHEDDGSFTAVTDYWPMDEHHKAALSAERARVIDEASTWILGLEAAIRECINFIESDMAEMAVYETERVLEDPTILERRPSFLPPVRPALRALGQQDTGGSNA